MCGRKGKKDGEKMSKNNPARGTQRNQWKSGGLDAVVYF